MLSKIYIVFYAKMSKPNADGLIPIYMRVTIGGKRIEVTTRKSVRAEKWQSKLGKVKTDSEETRAINAHFDMLKKQVYDYESLLIKQGSPVNAETMRNKLLGIEEKRRSLVQIF